MFFILFPGLCIRIPFECWKRSVQVVSDSAVQWRYKHRWRCTVVSNKNLLPNPATSATLELIQYLAEQLKLDDLENSRRKTGKATCLIK